jgi:hypothetical protein
MKTKTYFAFRVDVWDHFNVYAITGPPSEIVPYCFVK